MASAREGNPYIDGFETSVFDGNYITGDIDETYLNRLSKTRNDSAKSKDENSSADHTVIGLHNHA